MRTRVGLACVVLLSNAILTVASAQNTVSASDLQYLLTSLENRDYRVRMDAAQDLAKMGSAAVAPLAGVLKTGKPVARLGAAEALGMIRDDGAVDALIAALDDPETNQNQYKDMKVALATALGRQKSPRAVDALMRAGHPDNPQRDVRMAAMEALGEIGDPRAVMFLVRVLGADMYPPCRDAAEASLKKFTGQDFGYDQRKWLKWIGENRPEWRDAEKPRGLHPGFRYVIWAVIGFGIVGFGAVLFGWRNVR